MSERTKQLRKVSPYEICRRLASSGIEPDIQSGKAVWGNGRRTECKECFSAVVVVVRCTLTGRTQECVEHLETVS
jgi:hypothetical protein